MINYQPLEPRPYPRPCRSQFWRDGLPDPSSAQSPGPADPRGSQIRANLDSLHTVRQNQFSDTRLWQREVQFFILQLPSKKDRQFMLKRPKLADGFQGRAFKGNVCRESCRGHGFLLIGW